MKLLLTATALLFAVLCSGQSLTYSYSIDTFHTGANLRVDSMYLIESVTGFLVNDASLTEAQKGDRTQTLSTPFFFSDTADITAYANTLFQDSINMASKIAVLRAQSVISGAKARAIQHVRDSIIYGAWLYEIENPYKLNAGKQFDTRMGYIYEWPGIKFEAVLPERKTRLKKPAKFPE